MSEAQWTACVQRKLMYPGSRWIIYREDDARSWTLCLQRPWRAVPEGHTRPTLLCALPAKLGQTLCTSLQKKSAAWQSFA